MISLLVEIIDLLIGAFLVILLIMATVVLPYMMLMLFPLPITIAIVIVGLIVLKYL